MNAFGTEAVLCIVEITSKVNGLSSKWTVHEGLTERLKSERSIIKLNGPKDKLMDGRKGRNWTLLIDESGRLKKLKVDSPKY